MATAPKPKPKPNKDLPTKAGMNAIQKKLTKPKSKVTAPKVSLSKQVTAAKKAATPKKVASAAESVNISDYKIQGTRTAMRNRMQIDRSKTAGRAKNVASKLSKLKNK